MQRRQFLGASSALLGGSFAASLWPTLAKADGGAGKTVIVIFQRGGCDATSVVVPHGYGRLGVAADSADARYYERRPNIAIDLPGNANGALDLAQYNINGREAGLGLHPSLGQLHELYGQGKMAVFPAVQQSFGAELSHFEPQRMIDALPDAPASSLEGGWLNRYLQYAQTAYPDQTIRGAGMGGNLPYSLSGLAPTSNYGRFSDLDILAGDHSEQMLDYLGSVYGVSANDLRHAEFLQRTGNDLFGNFDLLQSLEELNREGRTEYLWHDAGLFYEFIQLARLLKSNVPLRCVALDSKAVWDTHKDQGDGAAEHELSSALAVLGNNIKAFVEDMEALGLMDNILLLVVSEFGRTIHENLSGGTDHGHASAWFAIGSPNTINGGAYLGRTKSQAGGYPDGSPITDWIDYDPLHPDKDPVKALGLVKPENMDGYAYMDHTIDVHDVFGEVLEKFLGVDNFSSIIGGFPYLSSQAPNFLR